MDEVNLAFGAHSCLPQKVGSETRERGWAEVGQGVLLFSCVKLARVEQGFVREQGVD